MLDVVKSIYRASLPIGVRKSVRRLRNTRPQDMVPFYQGPPRLSMVLPSYNVALYIEDFLESILQQDTQTADLELIFVDDGSTDATPQILADWAARYPRLIRVITQANAGAPAARNAGLRAARGKWVSFPDPDDYLGKGYIRHSRNALMAQHAQPLLAVVTRIVFFFEDTGNTKRNHPLDQRFRKPVSTVTTADMKNFVHLSGATIWMRRTALLKHGIEQQGQGWANFEDAHFVNRLLIAEPRGSVSFVRDAEYFYRKRSDGTSLMDTAKLKKAFYIDQLEDGILDLVRKSRAKFGRVPRFVQRTILYDLVFKIRFVQRNTDFVRAVLSKDEIAQHIALLHACFDAIDAETISDFHLAGCTEEHKVALLAMFKGARRDTHAVYATRMAHDHSTFTFIGYSGANDVIVPRVMINGVAAAVRFDTVQTQTYLGEPYNTTQSATITLSPRDIIAFDVDGAACQIKFGGDKIGQSVARGDLVRPLLPRPPSDAFLDKHPHIAALRTLARDTQTVAKYHDCWLLMDANNRADDNAEHLYRHLMTQPQYDGKLFFVLDPASRDWDRLAQDGFNLIPYLSDDHIAAHLNCRYLVSSHADKLILWPAGRDGLYDLAKYKFIFLQHGVIKDDLSVWLNPKPIDLFVTSAQAEYASIAAPQSAYRYSDQQTKLTGLPRHDRLLAKSKTSTPDTILIMPTWRRDLVVAQSDSAQLGDSPWSKVAGFTDTPFFQAWRDVLTDPDLIATAQRNGCRILFAPHPNMAKYIDDFDLPDAVAVYDPFKDGSYQDQLARGALLVTDYSSLAFDMAYLDRPTCYFHFDNASIYTSGHTYQKGYFDYAAHGFGPVATERAALVADVARMLGDDADPQYAGRRLAFFDHRDGQCCARVQAAIEAL